MTSAPVKGLADDAGIRPMTLVPAQIGPAGANGVMTLMSVNPGTVTGQGPGTVTTMSVSGGESDDPSMKPDLYISGGRVDELGFDVWIGVIGGDVTASVTTPLGFEIKSVKWEISGAMERQNYSLQLGETIELPGSVTHPQPPGTYGDDITFYWDENPGIHTIKATVDYLDENNPDPDPVSIDVDVRKPTVGFFKNEFRQLEFGPYRNPEDPNELSFYPTFRTSRSRFL